MSSKKNRKFLQVCCFDIVSNLIVPDVFKAIVYEQSQWIQSQYKYYIWAWNFRVV